jgi:hypothetical protein
MFSESMCIIDSGGGLGMAYCSPRHTSIRPKEPFEALYMHCFEL